MLNELIENTKANATFNIKETFTILIVDCTFRTFDIRFINSIETFAQNISAHDSFELLFVIDGNSPEQSITESSGQSFNTLREWVAQESDFENISFKLTIYKKRVDNEVSVYSLTTFMEFLLERSLCQILTDIEGANSHFEYLCIKVYEPINSFGSETLAFVSNESDYRFTPNSKREQQISRIKSETSISNYRLNLLPSDFVIEQHHRDTKLSKFFIKLQNALSFMILADHSEINENIIRYTIHGYKNLNGDIDINDASFVSSDFFRFYHFAVSSGHITEKLSIIRNIMSLHSNDDLLISQDECYSAIISNFNIYLQKNVDKYLQLKKDISDYICNVLDKANSSVDSFIANFRNNTIAVFTFFISIVIVNSLKDQGVRNLITLDSLIVLLCLILLSCIWLGVVYYDTTTRYYRTVAMLKENIKRNYKEILCDIDENTIFSQEFTLQNKTFFDSKIKFFTTWWLIVLVVMLMCFLYALIIKYCTNNGL